MKLILDKTELLKILTSRFGYEIDDCEITSPKTSSFDTIIPNLGDKIRNLIEKFDFRKTQKIAAIKALREYTRDNNDSGTAYFVDN